MTVNFSKFLRTPFYRIPLADCFCALWRFSDWQFLVPQRFKNICYWKIDCSKHYCLPKYFIKFPRTSSGTARAIATFKETTNCKIPQAVDAIRAPKTDFS